MNDIKSDVALYSQGNKNETFILDWSFNLQMTNALQNLNQSNISIG